MAADLCLRICRSHPAHVLAALTKAVLLTVVTNVVSSKPDFLTSYHNPPSAPLHVLFLHAPVGPPLRDSAVHANAG